MKKYFLGFLFVWSIQSTTAQSVPVGMNDLNDLLRIKQLVGQLDPNYSMVARPFFSDNQQSNNDWIKKNTVQQKSKLVQTELADTSSQQLHLSARAIQEAAQKYEQVLNFYKEHEIATSSIKKNKAAVGSAPLFYSNETQESEDNAAYLSATSFSFAKGKGKINILPLQVFTKYNSHHPYGWNDGAMIMAKGLQTSISTGFYAKLGFLSVQLQPEYTYSANPLYATTPGYGTNTGKSYTSFFPGNSSVRINTGNISLGVSTENLWWGPGQFSSLLMSNNAPGFGHISFNTTGPVKTSIGSFEWQLVVGKLNEDTSRPYETLSLQTSKWTSDWRYFNGMVFSYQPKFLPGIFIGATRAIHLYHQDFLKEKNSLSGKYLPVLGGIFTSSSNIVDSTHAPSDQALSLFMRWLLPNYQAEFYIEYGYNDYKQNLRDLSANANHASAYIIGFKKVVPLAKQRLLDFSGELTQMAQTTSYIVRTAGNWYIHGGVFQGLTYQNQILGAGSGFGNNVQTFSLKRISGFNYIGLKFQRIQQDPKGPGGDLTTLGMRENQWTDMAYGLLLQQKIKRFVLNAEIQQVASTNYGWQPGSAMNLFAQVRVGYYW